MGSTANRPMGKITPGVNSDPRVFLSTSRHSYDEMDVFLPRDATLSTPLATPVLTSFDELALHRR